MTVLTKKMAIALTAFVLASATVATAAPHGGRGFRGGHAFVGGHVFVGPRIGFRGGFYGPFSPYDWYYPYGPYWYDPASISDIRVKVDQKDAEVFLDGYYAGDVEQFDGAFQRLHVKPGGHVLTLYLDGYRTINRSVYVPPSGTVTIAGRMEALVPGETSTPPPAPAKAPAQAGSIQ